MQKYILFQLISLYLGFKQASFSGSTVELALRLQLLPAPSRKIKIQPHSDDCRMPSTLAGSISVALGATAHMILRFGGKWINTVVIYIYTYYTIYIYIIFKIYKNIGYEIYKYTKYIIYNILYIYIYIINNTVWYIFLYILFSL